MHGKNLAKDMARQAKNSAYCPYSGYSVGASVYSDGVGHFGGSNVELSGRMSTHAEEVACIKAVMAGAEDLDYITISTDSQDATYPCARCLHSLKEFSDGNMDILLDGETEWVETDLKTELPNSYSRGSREGHD